MLIEEGNSGFESNQGPGSTNCNGAAAVFLLVFFFFPLPGFISFRGGVVANRLRTLDWEYQCGDTSSMDVSKITLVFFPTVLGDVIPNSTFDCGCWLQFSDSQEGATQSASMSGASTSKAAALLGNRNCNWWNDRRLPPESWISGWNSESLEQRSQKSKMWETSNNIQTK